MKCDVHSKRLGTHVFSNVSPNQEVGRRRARNEALLCGIDPEDMDIVPAADPSVSRHLDRFGEEWYVDSDELRAAAPRPS
jgi:hypothetical protein